MGKEYTCVCVRMCLRACMCLYVHVLHTMCVCMHVRGVCNCVGVRSTHADVCCVFILCVWSIQA